LRRGQRIGGGGGGEEERRRRRRDDSSPQIVLSKALNLSRPRDLVDRACCSGILSADVCLITNEYES
jgi:hypothetical protein